jgi:hypothetical protein
MKQLRACRRVSGRTRVSPRRPRQPSSQSSSRLASSPRHASSALASSPIQQAPSSNARLSAVCVHGRDPFGTESVHGKQHPHHAHFLSRETPSRVHLRPVCVHGRDPFGTESVHGTCCLGRRRQKVCTAGNVACRKMYTAVARRTQSVHGRERSRTKNGQGWWADAQNARGGESSGTEGVHGIPFVGRYRFRAYALPSAILPDTKAAFPT